MNNEKILMKIIKELNGALDCTNGLPPRNQSKSYLRGYAAQYEMEQRINESLKQSDVYFKKVNG